MFEVYYPGNCFGNIDLTVKECKKCKIKSFCMPSHKHDKEDAGISIFQKMLFYRYVCETQEDENVVTVKCFEKDTETPKVIVEFNDNGQIAICKGEERITIQHIVSKEKAEDVFKKFVETA